MENLKYKIKGQKVESRPDVLHRIRRQNKDFLDGCLTAIYQEGYKKGLAAAEDENYFEGCQAAEEQLEATLGMIKGIPGKKKESVTIIFAEKLKKEAIQRKGWWKWE